MADPDARPLPDWPAGIPADLRLLGPPELAAVLGLSTATIYTRMCRAPERLPPPVANLGKLRWSPAVVRRWCERGSEPERRKGGRPRKTVWPV